MHSHAHHSGATGVSRKLIIASCLTLSFVVIELTVGLRAHSLALIGDAFHNFTDTLALLLALFAIRLERRPATSAKSYGYQRAGVLAAFINAGVLVALTIFLFIESANRLRHPSAVDSGAMLLTA
ncbi:MAG: cation diffusion facilitator family transporter, partial [Thermoanaerobaculia bacterium]